MNNPFIMSGIASRADRILGLAGVVIVGIGLATTAMEANKHHVGNGPEFGRDNHYQQFPDFNKVGSGICLHLCK